LTLNRNQLCSEEIHREHFNDACVGFAQSGEISVLALLDKCSLGIVLEQRNAPSLYHPRGRTDDTHSLMSSPAPPTSELSSNRRPSGTLTQGSTSGGSGSSTRTEDDPRALPSTCRRPKARLILKRPHQQSCSTEIDYRPLSPCLAASPLTDTDCCVIVGSAEEPLLHAYVPRGTTLEPCKLTSAFHVSSPVLALQYRRVDDCHIIAIACQDGMLQIVRWTHSSNISVHTVIVDGPLACLQIVKDGCRARLLVGSLSGHVCELSSLRNASWLGPSMILQDISYNGTEDPVLAVHRFALRGCNYVVIGTQSGQCLMLRQSHPTEWSQVWKACFPYSVHGLHWSTSEMTLVVITRRSAHICQGVADFGTALLKTRLRTLLLSFEEEQNYDVSNMSTLVAERSIGRGSAVLDADTTTDCIISTSQSNDKLST